MMYQDIINLEIFFTIQIFLKKCEHILEGSLTVSFMYCYKKNLCQF